MIHVYRQIISRTMYIALPPKCIQKNEIRLAKKTGTIMNMVIGLCP